MTLPDGINVNPQVNTPATAGGNTPAPSATIPVVPAENRNYATADEVKQLRDTINGINGNLQQTMQQVRSEVSSGFTTLASALGQLSPSPAQPVTPPVVTQPAAASVQPNAQEPNTGLMQRIADLEKQVKISARLQRLSTISPDLATNQDIVTLVSTSGLEDEQLFYIISGLRTLSTVTTSSYTFRIKCFDVG